MKLSKTQTEAIKLMRNGWELGISGSLYNRAWLQKGGCGKGGESKKLSFATFESLRRQGFIERHEFRYPTQTYRLTTTGQCLKGEE